MKNALHSDGSQQNGRRQSVAQEFNGEIALGHVAQHARNDAPAVEGSEIGAQGALSGSSSGNVVVGRWR